MSNLTPLWWSFAAVVGAAIGLLGGHCYFSSLRRTVGLYASATPLRGPLVLTFLRIAGAIVAFALLTRWSAMAAIGGLIGFTAARQWTQYPKKLD
jgi:hypothetical protein